MNPVYTILELPHRWLIVAGLVFLATILGTIFMFALVWPHGLALVWFYAGALVSLYFLIRGLREWIQTEFGDDSVTDTPTPQNQPGETEPSR